MNKGETHSFLTHPSVSQIGCLAGDLIKFFLFISEVIIYLDYALE